MDLFSTVILLAIFAETSVLTWRTISTNNGRLGRQKARRRLFVDSSALIDGRILSVAKAGFLGDLVYIPRSVIRELQLLADGSDPEKRARARFGLDVANELERVVEAEVSIYADDIKKVKVDERLIELAHEHKGLILTNDFNLIKVAAIEHVDAININELAQSLRSEYLPGDHLTVKVISAGANPRQGVAYLPDGTMVVIDDAEKFAAKQELVKIEFVRYLQTAAGKMMFAKLVTAPQKQNPKKKANAGTKSVASNKRRPNKTSTPKANNEHKSRNASKRHKPKDTKQK